jgi:hypothetical protein
VPISMSNQDRWPFSKPLEFLQKVKYGGAVGKLTVIAVAAILICGVGMIAGWGNQIIIIIAIAAVLLIVAGSYREIRKTLEKHPELALMDGTEIVALRKAEMAVKGKIINVEATPVLDPVEPQVEQRALPETEEEE